MFMKENFSFSEIFLLRLEFNWDQFVCHKANPAIVAFRVYWHPSQLFLMSKYYELLWFFSKYLMVLIFTTRTFTATEINLVSLYKRVCCNSAVAKYVLAPAGLANELLIVMNIEQAGSRGGYTSFRRIITSVLITQIRLWQLNYSSHNSKCLLDLTPQILWGEE